MEDHNKIELIAVFKKTVDPEQAGMILDKAGVVYREGMDSSKGKMYFYSTGPKFILTFQTEQERLAFKAGHKGRKEFHEIYVPDWTKAKD